MGFDRRFGHAQLVRDLLVEQAIAKKLKNLALLRRQGLRHGHDSLVDVRAR